MPSPDEIQHQQTLLATYRRTLAHQLNQQAAFDSGYVPAHLLNSIDEARAQITRLKGVLRNWHAPVEDMPNDEAATTPAPRRTPARPIAIPYPRNLAFVGRDTELAWLDTQLARPNAAVVLTAEGGTGKTQLATEYIHRCAGNTADWPGGAMWISMAQPEVLSNTVAGAGRALGLPGYDEWPLERQLQAVRDAWNAPDARLLVFDNCEDPALLREWRPTSGGTRVLLTARRTDWPSATLARLPLPQLPPDAALDLLLRGRAGQLGSTVATLATDTSAAKICEHLGYHALAIHLAGAFLAQQPRRSLARVLTELREQSLDHAALQALDPDSPTGYPRAVAETIALSYTLLDANEPTDALARVLLALAAHIAPGVPIPIALLQQAAQANEDDANNAVQRLCVVGLANYGGNDQSLSVHRLVAAYAGKQQDDQIATEHAEAVAHTLRGLTYETANNGFLTRSIPLFAHAQHVAMVAEQRSSKYAAGLFNKLGNMAEAQGDYAAARNYHSRAFAIWQQALPPGHLNLAGSLNNLGGVAHAQGDYPTARDYHTRAFAIREQALPPGHPDLAQSLNNLGALAHAQGDNTAARDYLSRALVIWEQALPSDHPSLATSLNNLGVVAHTQGDNTAARDYFSRALVIFEQALPEGHDYIRTVRGKLAWLDANEAR